jgi:lipoate-protein ligase A
MQLYNLGKVPWEETQLIYHALARLNRESLCLVSPSTPYVCIGYHQQADTEVDLDYCERNNLPVFRREVGGGAVYLDGDQYFFQLILRKDNPIVPKNKIAFYKKFIQPVIESYKRIGIPAEYKAVNDVISGSRKISGTGAGEIGDSVVFVGNLIMDFNYRMMSKILKVPDEKFRDKLHKTLEDNLSTIIRELGGERASEWSESSLNDIMVEEFQKITGPFEPGKRDELLIKKEDELREKMMTEEWLLQKGKKRISDKVIKIKSGTQIIHKLHKATGGLIRADYEIDEDRFKGISLSGDFFCFPEDTINWIEDMLVGRSPAKTEELLRALYEEKGIETPGVEIDDWLKVLGPNPQ